MALQQNSIQLAAQLGQEVGGEFAREVFEECQISFLLKAARHATFTSGFKGRLRENVLIVSPPGWGKSWSSETFIRECIGAIPYTESNNPGLPRPRFIQMDGGAITTESMRGGATQKGNPIMPFILCGDFYYCSDLPTFLGVGDNRTKAINMILLMAEDGKMDVFLSKFEEFNDKKAVAFEESSKSIKGMTYIAEPRRGFRLEAAVPFIFCCTHTELRGGPRSLEALAPGIFSRFTILEHIPSDKQVEDVWHMSAKEVDYSPLRHLNLGVWRTQIRSVPYPPERDIQDVSNWVLAEAKEIAKEYGTPLNRILNRRIKMRIARLMAAHAISRIIATRESGDREPVDVSYTKADAQFAQHKLGATLAMMAENIGESGDMDTREASNAAVKLYADYLRTLGLPWPTSASRRSFTAYCDAQRISKKTVANYLTALKKAAIIQLRHGADDMVNDHVWLESMRFHRPHEEAPPLEESLEDELL